MSDTTIRGFNISPQQRHLWMAQSRRDHTDLCSQIAVLVEGEIHPEILKRVLENVCRRHDILRTRFRTLPEISMPLQVICDDVCVLVREDDRRHIPAENVEADFRAVFQKLAAQGCALSDTPSFEVDLLKYSPVKRVLILRMPSLCADLIAMRNIVEQIGEAYFLQGRGESLVQGDPVAFTAIAEWLNDLAHAEEAERGRVHWSKFDFSALGKTRIPGEKEGGSFSPSCVTRQIRPAVAAKLESLAAGVNGSLAVMLLSCWGSLLARLASQESMVVGLVCDGRNDTDLESIFGPMEKTLPVSVSQSNSIPMSELVQQVTHQLDEAFAWQDCFTPELVSAHSTATAAASLPYCFEFTKAYAGIIRGELKYCILEEFSSSGRFTLKASCSQAGDGLLLKLHFDANRIDRKNVEAIADCFGNLLENLPEQKDVSLGAINILSPAWQAEILEQGRSRSQTNSPYRPVNVSFEDQVTRTPDKIAVTALGCSLTYAELNRRANELAAYLRRAGVTRQKLVGIHLKRSLDVVISVLAVLKAGAAFVPIDEDLPEERVTTMLTEAGVSAVLTHGNLVGRLRPVSCAKICLDLDATAIEAESDGNSGIEPEAHELAYVIFTSGSTGKPKGVLIPHSALSWHCEGMKRIFNLKAQDHVLQFASISFDVFLEQLLPPLLAGATVYLRTEGMWSVAEIEQKVADERLTVINLPTAYWHVVSQELFNRGTPCRLDTLRLVIAGGEAMSAQRAGLWLKIPGWSGELINAYGPTEATITSSLYKVSSEFFGPESPAFMPIGIAVGDRSMIILDRHLQLALPGTVGEICIGGKCLARGYLNDCSYTAEKFVPDPFGGSVGSRLYRTGDLGRVLPDGSVEFLGREDRQVKIRGFRIELGEIENVVRGHQQIEEVVVASTSSENNGQQIAAYITAKGKTKDLIKEVRELCKRKLPDYMVPTAIILMKQLPLLPNGKIDRASLPAPVSDSATLEDVELPRTKEEAVLVDVWKQLLKLERVGINQDFFELGGHSLLATQLVSRAQEAFMVEVELRRFFENPTIAALAATIVESKKAPAQTRVPAVQPISRELENTEVAATVAAYSESEIDGLLKKILKENTTNE